MSNRRFSPSRQLTAAVCALLLSAGSLVSAAAPPGLKPAQTVGHATQAELLAVARAGQRLVAVGDHGVVLLSDDEGGHWQQAHKVPFDGLLTGVSFVDRLQGWAVGHAGVILHTGDGGETWQVQRSDTGADRPLFGVHFFDGQHGVAVGLWSLVLTTDDGGRSWATSTLSPPQGASKADLNLLSLFPGRDGELYATAERGMVLRSVDGGHSWTYLGTGYRGSFWAGLALPDGGLVVAGMRGSMYRSADAGKSWVRVDTGSNSSITGLTAWDVGGTIHVTAVGLDGLVLRSGDSARTFTGQVLPDRPSLTGITLLSQGRTLLLTRAGPRSLTSASP